MILGFIGAGNMATAILKGVVQSKTVAPDNIWISDACAEKLTSFEEIGVHVTVDNKEVVAASDMVIMAVKPGICPLVLDEIKDVLGSKLLVSIAAGVSVAAIKEKLNSGAKVIRTMPNTPAMVGEGMTVLCREDDISDDAFSAAERVFKSIGKTAILSEKLLDIVTAVSGSSPAYVFMMIEAMADAGVQGGLPRDVAYTLCAQAVLGSAKMVLETGKHPGELKDMVCSPSGTTIDAVHQLEQDGFRAALMNAVERCAEKSYQMGRQK